MYHIFFQTCAHIFGIYKPLVHRLYKFTRQVFYTDVKIGIQVSGIQMLIRVDMGMSARSALGGQQFEYVKNLETFQCCSVAVSDWLTTGHM